MSAPPAAGERPPLVRRARLLEAGVIGYNLLEGSVAIVAGLLAGSVALVGFGLDSAIEVSASVAVLIHLWHNAETEDSIWEQRIAMFVGLTLIAPPSTSAARRSISSPFSPSRRRRTSGSASPLSRY